MKIIVGLGNPDDKYKNTFHNLGFMAVEKTAEKLNANFSANKFRALVAETKIGTEKVVLVKPLTYMNLSGESVLEVMSFYKADLSDLLVIYDDFDLSAGTIRIREKGSAGTHNGMRNIISLLGSGDFARIRVGFKTAEAENIPLINYVLSGIKQQYKDVFDKAVTCAGDAGAMFAQGKPIQEIMQKYNGTVK